MEPKEKLSRSDSREALGLSREKIATTVLLKLRHCAVNCRNRYSCICLRQRILKEPKF